MITDDIVQAYEMLIRKTISSASLPNRDLSIECKAEALANKILSNADRTANRKSVVKASVESTSQQIGNK